MDRKIFKAQLSIARFGNGWYGCGLQGGIGGGDEGGDGDWDGFPTGMR